VSPKALEAKVRPAELPGGPEDHLLAWENLGAQPARRAFRRSLWELLVRPGSFFRKMAVTGGLDEPIAFFAIVLTALILVSFPAALAYFGLAAPDPERMAAEVYRSYVLPARLAGLVLVLLPVAVVGASVAAVLLGTLFHVGGKTFGAHNWEGSVSVWLYSASAGLVPVVAAVSIVLVVALGGYLLGIPWPASKGTTGAIAQGTATILLLAGPLAGLLFLLVDVIVGCTRAFELDGVQGAAAGVSGLLLVAVAAGAALWAYKRGGVVWGLIAAGTAMCVAAVVAGVAAMQARRAGGEA
jgi:hypothetical protein